MASLLAAPLASCGPVADLVDRRLNPVVSGPEAGDGAVDAAHSAFHRGLFVADLHADTLLWDRDILQRSGHGHVDLPRLRKGEVDLQVFAVVTKTPGERPMPGEPGRHCVPADGLNTSGLLTAVQLRPFGTWTSFEKRALHQAERLREAAARSRAAARDGRGPELVLIEDVDDLRRVVARSSSGEAVVGAVLGIEGVHWVEDPEDERGAMAAARTLFDAGFRVVAPTHRFDNALAGAGEGCHGGGLTPAGRALLLEAAALNMVVDLAHASKEALLEATRVLRGRGPVVVSHTGVRGACAGPCYAHRNLTNEEVRAVAATGGVVGIGYWPEAVGEGVGGILGAMAHARAALSEPAFAARMRQLGGRFDPADHIALGSDFDGAVVTPFDATGVPSLTARMRAPAAHGSAFSDGEVRRIAGANVCRVLALRLPGGGATAAGEICGPLLAPAAARPFE